MITEKEIRDRFGRRNLRKLANKMLAETTNYAHGKTTETPHPRYILRPGVDIDTIIDSIHFGGIFDHTNPVFADAFARVDNLKKVGWPQDEFKLRLRHEGEGYRIILSPFRDTMSDIEKVDAWICYRMMNRDRFVEDMTSIDIYI